MSKRNKTTAVKRYLLDFQAQCCHTLGELSPAEPDFSCDKWQHTQGGGGITRTHEAGQIIEQGGVNFSHIYGNQLPTAATKQRTALIGQPFEAMGVSIVIHPQNPYAPTAHANLRFLSAGKNEKTLWWFGGGFDLTPYYGFEEDCVLWHRAAKHACSPLGNGTYEKYKKACDDYFFLKHRNEARGIGGLFFDDLNQPDFETGLTFIQNVGQAFITTYHQILARRHALPYTEKQRAFQLYRRGRYVEFNLLYDRGTLFGIQSGGRTESILISLPPQVRWQYHWQPEAGSEEAKLYTHFLKPREWAAYGKNQSPCRL